MPIQHFDIAGVENNLEFIMNFHLNRFLIDSHAIGQGLDEIHFIFIKSKLQYVEPIF